MSSPNDPAPVGQKIAATAQVASLYAVGAIPAHKPSLIRSTRTVIKWLWIVCLVVAPLLVLMSLVAWLFETAESLDGYGLSVTELRFGLITMAGSALVTIPMLRELLRIIDSAMTGDPFVPENAYRLRRIGWLLFSMTLLSQVGDWILQEAWLPSMLGGLVTVLLVFVLAEIFEKGSSMRTEIQETV